MQPLRRLFVSSLSRGKAVASQCLTTTTSNQYCNTAHYAARQGRFYSLSARVPILYSHPRICKNLALAISGRVVSRRGYISKRKYSNEAPTAGTGSSAPAATEEGGEVQEADVRKPSYQLTFTCKPCGERSTHVVSQQGYHKGTVLIACPGCNKRHLIADHLKIFNDKAMSLEDILAAKGEVLKKAHLNPAGDIELWPEEPAEDEAVMGGSVHTETGASKKAD